MKKEFITLSILSSSLILFYFLFPVLQENIFKKKLMFIKEDLYLDQILKHFKVTMFFTTFDIVRISKNGDVVMAGKSEPNETIELLDGEEIIAEVSSDENGEWIWVSGFRLKAVLKNLNYNTKITLTHLHSRSDSHCFS